MLVKIGVCGRQNVDSSTSAIIIPLLLLAKANVRQMSMSHHPLILLDEFYVYTELTNLSIYSNVF